MKLWNSMRESNKIMKIIEFQMGITKITKIKFWNFIGESWKSFETNNSMRELIKSWKSCCSIREYIKSWKSKSFTRESRTLWKSYNSTRESGQLWKSYNFMWESRKLWNQLISLQKSKVIEIIKVVLKIKKNMKTK